MLATLGEITTLDAVQLVHIRQWLIAKREQGVSPETLHNAYRNPRAWRRFCTREGLATHNPFATVPTRLRTTTRLAKASFEVSRVRVGVRG